MTLHRLRSLLLLGSLLALLAGCAGVSPDESTVPWSRPADWEKQGPDMGAGF
jgi:hypothetical protein